MTAKSDLGFVPLFVLIIGLILGTSVFIVADKSLFFSRPNVSTSSAQLNLSPRPIATASASTSTLVVSKKPSPSPSATNNSSSSSSSNNSNNSNSSSSTNTNNHTTTQSTASSPTPSPTTSPSDSPSPSPSYKTYTWSGDHINTKTVCNGSSNFGIEVSGDVPSQYPNGIWTTLTGNGSTIIVSYQSGDSTHVAFNFTNQVNSIRAQSPISLNVSGSTTYGYQIQAYGAPYTDGIPSLSNPIASVNFATDCR